MVAASGHASLVLPLSHAGRWITDARGRVVIVHGTNMVYKLAPYYPQAVGFGDADAALLQRLGFNVVRVGVIWKALEPRPGIYDDSYLAHIASTVATLARHGIVSLLDFHQDMYNERFQGEGFPDWAVQDNGLPAVPRLGFSTNYLLMPALQRAYDNFWTNSPGPAGVGLEDRYAAAWRHVAQYFGGNRHVLGYELMNEPFPGTTWAQCLVLLGCPLFDATLTAFNQRVANAIRTVDRRTLIFYEPPILFDFGANSAARLSDPRAGFAFHDYCFEFGALHSSLSCAVTGSLVLGNAVGHVRQTGDALLMTEFGDPSYSLIAAMVERADQNMIPWIEWAFCPCHDPTGMASQSAVVEDPAAPPTGSNLNLAGLRLVVEPYPQVIAGTPVSWGFDRPSRTFQLSYTTARVNGGRFGGGAVTEVALPPLVYPRGYTALVTGGRVASARNAAVLRIAALARSSAIGVMVWPHA